MKTMKGKYMTTSLLLAILASERTQSMNISETKAVTEGHEIIWSKNIPTASQLRARMQGRDELKFV